MVNNGIARISRHKKDLHVRLAALHPPSEFAPIDSRQHHVGQKQIDLAAPAVNQSQRRRRIGGLEYVVFQFTQSLDNIRAHVLIVFDDQNGLAESFARHAFR